MKSLRLIACLVCALAASCSATRSDKIDYAPDPGLTLDSPPATEAVVVFLRPDFAGHGHSAALYDGDAFLTILMADSHYIHRTEPGQHTFTVVSESADFLDAELAGGRIYFAEVDPRMGWWRTRFSLYPVTPNGDAWGSLEQWLDASYEITPNDGARTWARGSWESAKGKIDAELPGWKQRADRPQLRSVDGVTRFPD